MVIKSFKSALLGMAFAAAVLAAGIPLSHACTRILWPTRLGAFVGRTMDWPESTEPMLVVFPRGIKRNGGVLMGHTIVKSHPLTWTSKYGSIVVPTYGAGTIDGMNSRGLAVHLLYFNGTDFGPRDPHKKAIQAGAWGQYILDNAATVKQAIELMKNIQIVMIEVRGHKANLHLAVEDATGDSAIMEYEKGKLHLYHGRDYRLLTNDPAYPVQLKLLGKKDFSKPSREMPLPGNVNPIDRFQRASYYLGALSEPKTDAAAVAAMRSLLYNVSVPIDAPYKGTGDGFSSYSTDYRTITDLSRKTYYLQLAALPGWIWVDLSKIDLSPGTPVLELNPDNPRLFGNVAGKLKAVKAVAF